MKKLTHIRQIFKEKKSQSPIFYGLFQQLAMNREGFFFFYFHIIM
jgi:hypothetical protein